MKHPTEQAFITLLQQNYPDIHFMHTIHGGLSGATVLLVRYRLSSGEGLALAKIDRIQNCREEVQKHRDARGRLAQSDALHYVPRIVTPSPLVLGDGFAFVLYEPAHGSLSRAGSLTTLLQSKVLSPADTVGQIELLLERILRVWHQSAENMLLTIPQLMKRVFTTGEVFLSPSINLNPEQFAQLPRAIEVRRNQKASEKLHELDDRILQFDLPDRNQRLLVFQPGSVVLPNPTAYLIDETLWSNVRPVVAPISPVHGDLHGGNIIIPQDVTHTVPWLIDFARYDQQGLLFFDLAYLELVVHQQGR